MSPALSLLRVWHPPPSLGEVPGVCRILFRLLLARLRFGLLFGFDLAAKAKLASFSSPRARAGASSGRARGADEKGGRKGEDPSRRQPENTSVASRRLGMARLMREQCPLRIPLPVMLFTRRAKSSATANQKPSSSSSSPSSSARRRVANTLAAQLETATSSQMRGSPDLAAANAAFHAPRLRARSSRG